MRRIARNILERLLRDLSRRILRRYHPRIVGVTGSAGKTSAVNAIALVLATRFRVRQNLKNYNNEIGVPLSIIGMESGRRSMFRWLRVFSRAIALILSREPTFPEVLVLELGADKPGDLAYLLNFVPLEVGVVTAVGPVHLEFFKSLERIVKEKSLVVTRLPSSGIAVLNTDDPVVATFRNRTKAKLLTYGFSEGADVRASDVSLKHAGHVRNANDVFGVLFKVTFEGNVIPMQLPHVLGQHQVGSALAALAVGARMGVNHLAAGKALENFIPPPGRLRLIPGVKRTLILDDSYNSSPQAALAALKVAVQLPNVGRTFAALGDMAELGTFTVEGHREVGRAVDASGIHELITVGEKARIIADTARDAGFPGDRIFHFGRSEEAGRFLQDRIRESDLVLVKGSQVVRMEKIVKELMAEPERAEELLVRQGEGWE